MYLHHAADRPSCSFFPLFGAFIYRLTSDAASVIFATLSVLDSFASMSCIYLELRTTPRAVPSTGLTLSTYVDAVLLGFAAFEETKPNMKSKLILSIDRRHTTETAEAVVELAIRHRGVVVGVDLCGDPTKGDARAFRGTFARAKAHGLKVTVHLGEVSLFQNGESVE